MSRSKASASTSAVAKSTAAGGPAVKEPQGRAVRETVESIAVAVVLAFLFRAFVAEAFVIPTGSMAPTLQGRHMDVACEKCQFRYRTGASIENDGPGEVVATTCPLCGYVMTLDKGRDANQRSFSGDRILVSKFAYEIAEPERWEVIVFKYPGNAKINYIKRLIGLPNEAIRIRHGDIYHRPAAGAGGGEAGFRIARKPPYKLEAMLQLVHDTDYQAPELLEADWPRRWQDWQSPEAPSWLPRPDGEGFETAAAVGDEAWLRYRHAIPWESDWQDIAAGRDIRRAPGEWGQLIADYYAYNDGEERTFGTHSQRLEWGLHWVGDLAFDARVDVGGDTGHVLLDLVEGGVHYTCRIDVATGEAVLSIDGGQGAFGSPEEGEVQHPRAVTNLRGAGRYRLKFANADDQLLLWVDGDVASFDGPTTYVPEADVQPQWSEQDAGDLEPAGIGADGVQLAVSRLRLYRDVYYVATTSEMDTNTDYSGYVDAAAVREVFASPKSWSSTPLFDARRPFVEFVMGEDQFFPLGDNSPQSKDARLWSERSRSGEDPHPPPWVRRELLTGKALLVYWPHPWNSPIPFFPNFKRMGLIR